MEGLSNLLETGTPALVAMATMAIVQAIKASKLIPDNLLPVVSLVIGSIGYGVLEGFSGKTIVLGIVVGFSATGGHQLLTQSLGIGKQNES